MNRTRIYPGGPQPMKFPTADDLAKLAAAEPVYLCEPEKMIALLGILQLVLRRLDLPATTERLARDMAKRLEAHIVAVAPGCKELCAAGWNPRIDL